MDTLLKKLLINFLYILFIFPAFSATAQEYENYKRSPFLPDDAIVQYAGSIGFASLGAGYSLGKGNFETDILLGYVPESIGGNHIWTAAVRANWLPWRIKTGKRTSIIPLTTGLMISHTFGKKYFVLQPDYYPKNYYTFSTAVHLYYQLGGRFQFELFDGKLPMALYYELNSSAEATFSLAQNRRALTPADIFHLSLGLRVSLP